MRVLLALVLLAAVTRALVSGGGSAGAQASIRDQTSMSLAPQWAYPVTLTGADDPRSMFRFSTAGEWFEIAHDGGDGRVAIVPPGQSAAYDGEVRSVWGPSRSLGIEGHGQHGHVLRLIDTGLASERAVVVTRDIFQPWLHNVQIMGHGWWGSDGRSGVVLDHFDFASYLGTDPSTYAPYWVATRLTADVVEVKIWRPSDPEPGWRAPGQSGRTRLAPSDDMTGAGHFGLYAGHLAVAGDSLRFADVTISGVPWTPPSTYVLAPEATIAA